MIRARHLRTSFIQQLIAGATSLAIVFVQLALPPQAEAAHLGSSTASIGSAPPPVATAIESFQPDLFTGRATTAVPIIVPPGRQGIQPNLALAYASSTRNGWLGVGWNLDVGSIERSTKRGVPKYDSSDTPTFLFQGVASDLVKIADGTYRAKDEGLFLRFENKGVSGWEVRDKSGTRYLFGQTVASQIEHGGKIFRWALDQVIDPHDNSLTISYAKDQGQLYPAKIEYTSHTPTQLAPAHQVVFHVESRSDSETSYRAGFAITTAKRLRAIEINTTVDDDMDLVRRYECVYTQSRRTNRSLLQSVTQVGADGTTRLPPITLTYQEANSPTYTVISNSPMVTSTPAWNVRETASQPSYCVHPSAGLPWSSARLVATSDGSLTTTVPGITHAWTYVYTTSPRTISLPYRGAELCQQEPGGDQSCWFYFESPACVYREDSTSIQFMGNNGTISVPLSAGWSIIHLTSGYQDDMYVYPVGSPYSVMSAPLKDLVTIMSPSPFIKPQLAGDVDGNATSDLVTFDATSGTWTVSCSSVCPLPPQSGTWLTGFGDRASIPLMGDWNGDGNTDIAIYTNGSWQFATSTGTSFRTGTVSSISLGSGIPLTGDFNGDEITDIGLFASGSWSVALGTGSGFTPTGSFSLSWGDSAYEPLTGDFNGDGLTDIALAHKSSGNLDVRLATGNGWTASTTWISGFGPNQPHTSADFNGDGLSDTAYYDKASGQVRYAPSTGSGFGTSTALPLSFSLTGADDTLQVADINGDGLSDPAVFNAVTGSSQLAISQGTMPDLLLTLTNGLGGMTTLTYQLSTQLANTRLPFVIPVVQQTTISDGLGNTYANTLTYSGGVYDAPSKEFRGFAMAEVRDPEATVTQTEFHQDEHKKGRPFRTQVRDASGNSWVKIDQTWSCVEPSPGVHFTKLDQADSFTYDGDATFRQSRGRFTYDAAGNLTTIHEDGDVGVSGDERTTAISYAPNETDWLLSYPTVIAIHGGPDTKSPKLSERRLYYDEHPQLTDPPVIGNLTTEEEWLHDPREPEATSLSSQMTYDAYGNVLTITNPLERTVTFAYDSATQTYVEGLTNALDHTSRFAYDRRFGTVIQVTDPNEVAMTADYDVFGRIRHLVGPDDTTERPAVSYEYDLSSRPSRVTTIQRIQSGYNDVRVTHTFLDGLGRAIQTRSPAEEATQQIVSGVVAFNRRGFVEREWLPTIEAVSSAATAPDPRDPTVRYAYDPLGRLTSVTDPDGSRTQTIFQDWTVATIDANGHRTMRTVDGLGRVVTVEEEHAGQTATTTYRYDALDNLVQVIDAVGHSTRLEYDTLARKIAMEDPDAGRWEYRYDAMDNLTQQTDARGVTTSFTYDAANRLIRKAYADASLPVRLVPVAYTYDNPDTSFSVGQLTEVSDGSGTVSLSYDALGRLTKEQKTVQGTPYTVERTYDLLGRTTSLTYPDSESLHHTYNLQGGLERLTSSTGQTWVANMDYHPAGLISRIDVGSGLTASYTYDEQTLRLSRLLTTPTGAATPAFQDFIYAYDDVGNLTTITDGVDGSASQAFGYDDLNRLIQATGRYGTFAYRYDPLGNLIEKEGLTLSYGLPDGTKPHAVTSTSTGWQFSYDDNGNLVARDLPESSTTSIAHGYDAENRLAKIEHGDDGASATLDLTLTLVPGWNLVSFPHLAKETAVAEVLLNFGIDYDQLTRLNPTTGYFESFVDDATLNQFETIDLNRGYWLYVTNPDGLMLSFTGTPAHPTPQTLEAGWHLLPGPPQSLSIPDWLKGLVKGVDYNEVLTGTPGTEALSSAAQIEPGHAYYLQLLRAVTWTPPALSSMTTRFVYDGDGGRVQKLAPQGTTTYLGELYELGPDGRATKYIYAGDLLIAALPSGGVASFNLGDHLGSGHLTTDPDGLQHSRTEYTPFGSISLKEGSRTLPQQFTGQRLDEEVGLYFFQARYYDHELGRFLSPDPLVTNPFDPQDFNRYAYVRNNPTNFIDPSGLKRSFFRKFLGAAVATFLTLVAPEGAGLWWSAVVVAGSVSASAVGGQIDRRIDRRFSSEGGQAASPVVPVPTSFPPLPSVSSGPHLIAPPTASPASTSPLPTTLPDLLDRAENVLDTALTLQTGLGILSMVRGVGARAASRLSATAASTARTAAPKIRYDPAAKRFRDLATGRFIPAPGGFKPGGGKIALGRFDAPNKPALEALAKQHGAHILDQPFPRGIDLADALRAEIDAAESILFRMKDVVPGKVSYDVEYRYIMSQPRLRAKTEFRFD